MSPSSVVKKAEVMDGSVVGQMIDDEPRKSGRRGAGFVTNARPSGAEFNPVTGGNKARESISVRKQHKMIRIEGKRGGRSRDVTSGPWWQTGKLLRTSPPRQIRETCMTVQYHSRMVPYPQSRCNSLSRG